MGTKRQKSLIFRTEGSIKIGMGHLTRCMTLAQALRQEGWASSFLMRSWPASEPILQILTDECFPLNLLPADAPPEVDAETLVSTAKKDGVSMVVLDGYGFGAEYEKNVREAGLPILVIDDLGGFHSADIILNQNLFAATDLYSVPQYTRLLLGSHYVLLNHEFLRAQRFLRPIVENGCRVLVTFGGADPHDVTAQVVSALSGSKLDVAVVVGAAAYLQRETLLSFQKEGVRILGPLRPTEMAAWMEWSDLAICGGGTTCWELAYLGVPSLVVVLEDNQVSNAERLEQIGAARNLGWYHHLTREKIIAMVKAVLRDVDLRRTMSITGQGLVDGKGTARVVSALQERYLADNKNW